MQPVTLEELKRHSTAGDCWLALHGVVYDVTAFLPSHPGGPEIVEAVAGCDASAEFEDALHSVGSRREPSIQLKGVLEGWEARVEGYRQQGWSEDQGVPDLDSLAAQPPTGLGVSAGLGLALALGTAVALAAAWFAARARKG
mmetsp:Transcript_91892/g.274179  ORF Transcript_91892/g.274179 Transcript_91892/m.274179 type:complete len:142 (-) Transcript_91892:36-461(-)